MKRTVVIKKELIAEEEARLLKLVHANPGLSRLEIAKLMRISAAAAGYYVDRLLKDQFLLTGEIIKQGRGRPKAPLYLNEHIGCFLGLDISGSYIRACCLDFASNILYQDRTLLPDATPNTAVYAMLAKTIKDLKGKVAPPFKGIGLSLPVINRSVPEFVPLKLHDVGLLPIDDIARRLSEEFDVPVIHETSINALGYGEMHYGAGLRYNNCISILARTDVSACTFVDGRLINTMGKKAASGMIGQWMCPRYLFPAHTAVRMESVHEKDKLAFTEEVPVEQVVSMWGLAWQIKHALQNGQHSPLLEGKERMNLKEIRYALQQGDSLAAEHVQASAIALGWTISQLVQLFHPEQITLSGIITELGLPFLNSLREFLGARLKGTDWDPAQVMFSELGDYSVAIGAAATSLDKWRPSR